MKSLNLINNRELHTMIDILCFVHILRTDMTLKLTLVLICRV